MEISNLRSARPRDAEDIARLPSCPDVVAAAQLRGIKDVLHFTTLRGITGVLASRTVKSRARLREDLYLEHVYEPNAPVRKDKDWLDYVSLSIARINDWMFGHSERWHAAESNPWVVLSFDPVILGHPGVVFATTNNIYPACRRSEGRPGFEQLFSGVVRGRYGELHDRADKRHDWPTDRQAEVLYPGELSCEHLQRVDVQFAETADTVYGTLSVLELDIPVRHAPEVFK